MRPDQNELWERYEDAMFAILMDEVAHQEGQEQLEWKKQLNDDPSAALPEEVRKKGEQTIRKAFAAQGRRSAKHISFRLFQRIAVAVLVIVLTTVCAFAAFPEIRTGILNMIADVYVNEHPVSVLWTEPYITEISDLLRQGNNTLTVKVTSTWFNRLAYDASQPESERKTWTISGPAPNAPLRESGLMGPVTISY